jgi:hypothetical protein
MTTLDPSCETVDERVERLIGSRGGSWPPRHTTTTNEAIAGLIARQQSLEEAIREIAMEVQRLETAHERLKAHH